jgi:hypothetical protein
MVVIFLFIVIAVISVCVLLVTRVGSGKSWPDKNLLIRLTERCKGGRKIIRGGERTTWEMLYDAEFAPCEELLVVAELYQWEKPMRPLGQMIFPGSNELQELKVCFSRVYENEAKTIVSHRASVRVGAQFLEIPRFTVYKQRYSADESMGWYSGEGLRRLKRERNGQDYGKLETLLYYHDGGGEPEEGQGRFWIPGHSVAQAGSSYWVGLRIIPISRLKYLVTEPVRDSQGLDGQIIPADLTGEQSRAIAQRYKKRLMVMFKPAGAAANLKAEVGESEISAPPEDGVTVKLVGLKDGQASNE